MATGGSKASSDTAEDQRDGVKTILALTSLIVTVDSNTGKDTVKALGEPAEPKQDGVKVCQFFMVGKCHFGVRCRLSHNDPSPDDSGDISSDVDDKQDRDGKMEKQTKKKGSAKKAAKPKHEEKGVDKKPRMRTADDVISRILWDPSVDASEFVVGYVDRFLGVLERPFCDFSWDTNPCDCDYSAELALPRHRIQYFTYRGLRVWDRHTRTDRVFGSTGQSLAPPFGGEEEVNGVNIPRDQEKQLDYPGTAEDQPAAISGQHEGETEELTHSKNSHLEEDELNEMIHTKDATHSAAECEGNTYQKSQGACVAEEAANRLQDSSEQIFSFQQEEMAVKEKDEEENYVELEESWEGTNDTQNKLAALQLNPNPSESPKLVEEKDGGRPPKKQPTHFITFRANTPAILSSFQQLQEELTALLPSSAPHWQTASKLHVTLCLLVLRGPAEVAAAGEILRQFARLDRNPPVAVTFPVKLKHFNGKVLYLSPQPQLHLQQLNSGLQEAYRKEGWLHRSSYNPRYHLTLAKVADAEGERIFERVGDLKVGKGLNFSRLPVNSLHLCAMNGTKADGFYDTVCTVTLR